MKKNICNHRVKAHIQRHYIFGLLWLSLLLAVPAQAREWTGIQGDVVRIGSDAPVAGQLQCFSRNWPVHTLNDGTQYGWIGIDLKTKPGVYTIRWGKQRHHLRVKAGSFRISRITVKKQMSDFDAKALKRIRHDQQAILKTYSMKVNANPAIEMAGMPIEGVISTPFGAQRYVNGNARSPHSGLDIAAAEGTPIEAPLAGQVLLRESMFLNGNVVVLGHGNGLVSVFAHMKDFAVQQGEWVSTGQRIGRVGTTGRSTGPHLHWGVRFNKARINPASLLQQGG